MLSNKDRQSLNLVVTKLRPLLGENLPTLVTNVIQDSIAIIEAVSGSLPQKLSDHFCLEEFLASPTAVKNNITLNPSATAYYNLSKLVTTVLEPARLELGKPIYVSSGYRSQSLNRLVGGVATSYHLEGRAADVSTANGFHKTLFNILSKLPHVELIDYGNFIHVAL